MAKKAETQDNQETTNNSAATAVADPATTSHPMGWAQHGTKCAECGQAEAYLHDKVHNPYGLCKRCYTACWAGGRCFAPGCDNPGRDAGNDRHGIYCDEHFDAIVAISANAPDGWCAIPGCDEKATIQVNGYPLCSAHSDLRVPFKAWKPREDQSDKNGGNGHSHVNAPAATVAKAPRFSEEERSMGRQLAISELATMAMAGSHEHALAQTEIIERVIALFGNPVANRAAIKQLEALLPAREIAAEPSQPDVPPANTGKK